MPPKFRTKSELTRYVDRDQRLPKNFPANDAFIASPGQSHLSVNSLEVEKLQQIAKRYRDKLQRDDEELAICIHKIFEYNASSRGTSANIRHNRSLDRWEFTDRSNKAEPAYRHRPSFEGDSHCGIEFIRALSENEALKVARRLAKKKFRISA